MCPSIPAGGSLKQKTGRHRRLYKLLQEVTLHCPSNFLYQSAGAPGKLLLGDGTYTAFRSSVSETH